MEREEECVSQNYTGSPKMAQGFQANRFMKINSNLTIPDTIPEQSGELSSNSLKSKEVPKITIECLNVVNNISETLQSSRSDDSSIASTIIPVDNSFILDCEKKLLELSNDEEKHNQSNKSTNFNSHGSISRKLRFLNDTISTPPNELRQQIHVLRDEIAESHEFHDLEMKIIMENLEEENDSNNYMEVIEKYSALMEMYTSLKQEYEQYRNEQENFKREIHSQTADCLETLVSQIEASDSSYNFSDISPASFHSEVKSSTMVNIVTLRETTPINNSTLTTQEQPLVVMNESCFKTPKTTPLRSCKKLLNLDLTSSRTKSARRDAEKLTIDEMISMLESEIQAKENNVNHLQKLVNERNCENENLKQAVKQFEELSLSRKQELTDLQKLLSEREADNENLKRVIRLLEEETAAKKNELNALQESQAEKIADLEKLTNSLRQLEEESLCKKEELNKLSESLREYMGENENLKKTVKEREEKLVETEITLGELREISVKNAVEMEKLQQEIQKHEEIDGEVKHRVVKLEEEFISKEEEYATLQKCLNDTLAESENLKQILIQREEEITAKSEELNDLHKSLSENASSTENLRELIQKLEEQSAAIHDDLNALKKSLNEATTENENLKKIIQQHEEEASIRQKNESEDAMSKLSCSEELLTEINGFENLLNSLMENKGSVEDYYFSVFSKTDKSDNIDPNDLLDILRPSIKNWCHENKTEIFVKIIGEMIFNSCKLIHQKLIDDFEGRKTDWAREKGIDQTTIENLKNQLKSLKDKKTEHEATMQETINGFQSLKELHKDLKRKYEEAESAISVMNEELLSLRTKDLENSKIHDELEKARNTVSKLQNEVDTAGNSKAEILMDCRKLKEAVKDLEAELEQRELRLNESLIANEKFQKEAENLNELIDDLQQKIATLQEELDELFSVSNQYKKAVDILRSKKNSFGDWLSNNSWSPFNNGMIHSILDKFELNKNERNTALMSAVSELVVECCNRLKRESDNDRETEKNEWDEENKKHLDLIENLQNEVRTLSNDLEECSYKLQVLENIQATCESLKEKIIKTEIAISKKDEQIAALQCVEKEKSKAEENLAEAQDTVEKLRTQLALTDGDRTEMANKCQTLEEAVATLKADMEAKEDAFVSSLDQMKLEMDNLRNLLNQSNERIAGIQKELDSVKNENEKCRSIFEALRKNKQILADLYLNLYSSASELREIDMKAISEAVQVHVKDSDVEILLSVVHEVITDCCGNIREESEKAFEAKRLEWQSEKREDLNLIETLRNDVKILADNVTEFETKVYELEQLNEKLSSEISEAETVISKKEEEIRGLESAEAERIRTVENLNEAERRIEKLQDELSKAKTESEAECRRLKDEADNLRGEIGEKEILLKDLERFRLSCKQLSEDVEELKGTIEGRNEELEEARRAVKKWESEKKCYMSLIENLQNEIKNLKEDIGERESEHDQLVDYQKSLETLTEEMSECKSALKAKIKETLGLESEKNEIQQMLNSAGEKLAKLKSELEASEGKLRETESRWEKVTSDNESLKTTIKRLNEELGDAKMAREQWETEKKDNLNAMESLREEIKHLKKSIAVQDSRLNELVHLRTSVERLTEEISEREISVAEKTDKINLLESQRNEIQEELDATRDKLYVLQSELAMSVEKRKQTESTCREFAEDLENLRDAIQKSKEKLEETKTANDNLESALNEKINEIRVLEEDKCQLQKKLNATCENLAQLTSEMAEREGERKEMENECRKMKDAVERKEILLKELEESLTSYESIKVQAENLKEQIAQSENVISELKKDLSAAAEELKQKEVLISETATLKKKNNDIHNLFEALKRNRKAVVEAYSNKSADDMNVISEKIRKVLSETFLCHEENDFFLNVIGETIFDCCTSLRDDLKKSHLEERGNLKAEADALKSRVESLTAENECLGKEVFELTKEVEALKSVRKDFLELSDRMRVLEDHKNNLINILSDIQSSLDMPGDTVSKLMLGNFENKKIFTEYLNRQMKSSTEGLKLENAQLKISNENLKEKVKELGRIMNELSSQKPKDEANGSPVQHSRVLRSASVRNSDLYTRRLDKLEEINHNLTELITRILTTTEFPNVDKLKFMSARDYPQIAKKVGSHLDKMASRVKELDEANNRLDEECESYAKTIKDLKKEAVTVWKSNKDKAEALESELKKLMEEKRAVESDREKLTAKVAKLDGECLKLRNAIKTEGTGTMTCNCSNETKKIQDLKRNILIKEQKILELQDVENQNSLYKSQIKYLENALEQERKKIRQEKEKIKKLQAEVDDLSKTQSSDRTKHGDSEMIDELRMGVSNGGGGVVQEFVDKERMRKLSKDVGILKELCRARYVEIRRLEAENAALKNSTAKNSNQMDSPFRVRAYNTRSRNAIGKEFWKPEVEGKENRT